MDKDKKNEELQVRGAFFKNVLLFAIICLLGSCTKEYRQEISITIPNSTPYSKTFRDVNVKISPTAVTVGDKILIDVVHEDGETIDVVLFSESLKYRDSITTPCFTSLKMDVVGTHDISFEVDGRKPELPAFIEVVE